MVLHLQKWGGLLTRNARHERWEQLGLDRVKSDLANNEGRWTHGVSIGSEELYWAWERAVAGRELRIPLVQANSMLTSALGSPQAACHQPAPWEPRSILTIGH